MNEQAQNEQVDLNDVNSTESHSVSIERAESQQSAVKPVEPMDTLEPPSRPGKSRFQQLRDRVTESRHWHRLLALVSLGLYCFDIGSDIATGITYLRGGGDAAPDTWWGVMTIVFAGIGIVITNCITVGAYFFPDDHTQRLKLEKNWQKAVVIVFCIFQLGPLYLYLHKLFLKQGKEETDDKYKARRDNHDQSLQHVRGMEGFTEAAPQLILQLYIMTKIQHIPLITVLCTASSLSSLVLVARSVYKDDFQAEEESYPYLIETCLILWPLFTIAPRTISLAMFASGYGLVFFPVMAGHWIITVVYDQCTMCTGKYDYHDNGRTTCQNYLDRAMLGGLLFGFVNIFLYIHYDPKIQIQRQIVFYYTLLFIETNILFVAWFVTHGRYVIYSIPAAEVVWGGFPLGIIFLVIFFKIGVKDHK